MSSTRFPLPIGLRATASHKSEQTIAPKLTRRSRHNGRGQQDKTLYIENKKVDYTRHDGAVIAEICGTKCVVVGMLMETVDIIKVVGKYSHRQSFVDSESREDCAEAEREDDDDEKKTFLDCFVRAGRGVDETRLSERLSLQMNALSYKNL